MSDFIKDKPEEYYQTLDKRSKEYKSYKKWKENFDKQNSLGLGDVVEKVTKATGIKKAVKFIAGEDCGCDKRKETLNKLPIRFKAVRCFTEQQYNTWTEFMKRPRKNEVTMQQQKEIIIPIYKQLFARQLKPLSCCVKPYIDEIQRVYDEY